MLVGSENHLSVLLLNCVHKNREDFPLFIPLSRKTDNNYIRHFEGELPTCSIENVNQEGPFNSRSVYIQAQYEPNKPGTRVFSNWTKALIRLVPPDHGFSLAEESVDGFMHWFSSRLILRVDLEGWELSDFYCDRTFMCSNARGEAFVLQVVKMYDRRAGFRIYIPNGPDNLEDLNWQKINLRKMNNSFASTTPTDRKTGVTLQANSEISISMRKKLLLGEKYHVVEINISRHRV